MTAMRAKWLLTSVLLGVGAVVAALWRLEQATARRLEAERDALRRQQAGLARLQAERRHLRGELLDAIRRTVLSEEELARKATPVPMAPSPSVTTVLVPGEWAANSTWANRGRTTAAAAIETVLWAAANGDLPTLLASLEMEESVREKALSVLNNLPAETRQTFGTPEGMIAAATLNSIPITKAQMIWLNEVDPDHAVIGLRLSNFENAPEVEPERESTSEMQVAPPALPESNASKLAYISLRRGNDGWKLVVPAGAVDRIERELRPAGG